MVDVPPEWTRGQLLNLRRYGDGSFIATLLGDEINEEQTNIVRLGTPDEAQRFVSHWYSKEHGR